MTTFLCEVGLSDNDRKLKIDVSAGASVKAELKTELPSDASGRFLDALTDIIRPFSERRGLRADLIRVQREEVLLEIAKLARLRAAAKQLALSPIPNRVLLPTLEHASNTDPEDNTLKQAWANLLVSASSGDAQNHALFADMLSKLDPEHVRFLENLCSGWPAHWVEEVPYEFQNREYVSAAEKFFGSLPKEQPELPDGFASSELEQVLSYFERIFIQPGSAFTYFCAEDGPDRFNFEGKSITGGYTEVIVGGLVALGIVEHITLFRRDFRRVPSWLDFHMKIVHLTHLWAEFVVACGHDYRRDTKAHEPK